MDCSKIKVVKKDGTKEEFNVKKVLAAISKSAERAMITFSKGREELYLRICGREGRGDGSGADSYCPDAQHCGRRSG